MQEVKLSLVKLKTYIIAEAGVNHNGSIDHAYELIKTAANAGADAVKFQTFQSKLLTNKSAELAPYQKKNLGKKESQFELLKKLELSRDEHFKLRDYAKKQRINFLSSPFDNESVRFLCEDLKLNKIKIPSGEITNAPYLWAISRYKPDIILSTGMASPKEIRDCLDVLAHGYMEIDKPTSYDEIRGISETEEGYETLKKKVTLLHCTSEYPAPYESVNLKAIEFLRNTFGLQTGLSDHSEGFIIPIAAVGYNASILEKHLTLNKEMPGPDHKASIEPDEFKNMVDSIRAVELAAGQTQKVLGEQELVNRSVVRKSLYAAKEISENEVFTEKNLIVLRPEHGISPMKYWDMIGKKATKAYRKGEIIKH